MTTTPDPVLASLRPPTLAEYVGQAGVVRKLTIALQAAKQRGEPLAHTLFHGAAGLGKTSLACIIAHEMHAKLITTAGPALERTGDLLGVLTDLQENDILFIDEIHRIPAHIEEFLYPAMEDYKVDFLVDRGMSAKSVTVPLPPFTLIGATTRGGSLSAPLRDRFGLLYHMEFYTVPELTGIVRRSAGILHTDLEDAAACEIAQKARGTPRVANRLLQRVRDYSQVHRGADVQVDLATARAALEMEGIDLLGLNELDRRYLQTLMVLYKGGPTGVDALASTLNEDKGTLEDMVEPYLLRLGFITRARRGRTANGPAYGHLGLPEPTEA